MARNELLCDLNMGAYVSMVLYLRKKMKICIRERERYWGPLGSTFPGSFSLFYTLIFIYFFRFKTIETNNQQFKSHNNQFLATVLLHDLSDL